MLIKRIMRRQLIIHFETFIIRLYLAPTFDLTARVSARLQNILQYSLESLKKRLDYDIL